MSWEILFLIALLIVAVLLLVFRKTAFVKSTWKYFLILSPLLIYLVLKVLSSKRKNISTSSPRIPSKESVTLEKKITKLSDKLQEVQTEVAIEVTAAKTKNEEVVKELEEVKKIEDKKVRRKRLADLMG